MLSPESEDRLVGKDDDTTGADDNDPQSSYVDDFEDAEEEGGANETAPFSFLGDDHDTAIDLDAAVQLSIMSTIDEERSGEDHSSHITASDPISQADPASTNNDPESRIPDELRGLTHHFQGDDDDDESTTFSEPAGGSHPQKADESHHTTAEEDDDDSSMEAIMKKLALLENTQTLLENVLDANYEGRDDSNVELVVKQALTQLKLASNKKGGGDDSVSETATMDDSSLKEEMEALQKLLDTSLPEEEGDGEAAAAAALVSDREQGQRQIDQVLKEYEDLERSLYSSRLGGGESCDEQESLRSDGGGGAPNNTITPHPPQFPWSNNDDNNKDNQTTGGNERQVLNQNRPIEIEDQQKQITFQPKRFRLEDSEQEQRHQDFPMDHDDHSKFMATKMKPRGTVGQDSPPPPERSRTKTIPKKIVPSSPRVAASASTPSVSKTKSSPPSGRKLAESQSTSSLKTPMSANKRVIQQTMGKRSVSDMMPSSPGKNNRGGGGGGGDISTRELTDLDNETKIAHLQAELTKQENLLTAYQEDNQKLYGAFKKKESEIHQKEVEWEELLNSLKTEMATLKIQRFVGVQSPSRPGSAGSSSNSALLQNKGKKELERYKEESAYKSEQIMELRKEIVTLQNRLGEIHQQQKVKNPAKMAKSVYLEKEKEWLKKIRGLNQQVRTLQKILYNKDPHNPAVKSTPSSDHPDIDGEKRSLHDEPQVAVLEGRIAELERNLEQADSDAKEKLKDFQTKLNSLKIKYEDQIKETESRLQESLNKLKLAECSSSVGALAEQQARLDRAMGEIGHLKQDLSRTKRDLEIAQRVTTAPNPNRQQDAGTLSLAIKRFKVELAEKEKDIVRLKKELGELNKTNVTLKRERERYLGGAAPHSVMIPSRIVTRVGNVAVGGRLLGGPGSKKGDDNINTGGVKHSAAEANINATVELLQDTLDYERAEFEGLLQHKRREIEERDRVIQSLRKQIASVTPREKSGGGDLHNRSFSSPSDKEALLSDELHRKEALLDELRSRVTSQNEVILRFKEHLTQLRGSEEKMARLEREQGEASELIQKLREKLQIAQAMSRPENEILAVLAQKFEDLNARYLQREDQMKLLLNKLSTQTAGTPRSLGYNNNTVAKRASIIEQLCLNLESSSDVDLDLRQLSPSLYEHLFSGGGGVGGGRGDPV